MLTNTLTIIFMMGFFVGLRGAGRHQPCGLVASFMTGTKVA